MPHNKRNVELPVQQSGEEILTRYAYKSVMFFFTPTSVPWATKKRITMRRYFSIAWENRSWTWSFWMDSIRDQCTQEFLYSDVLFIWRIQKIYPLIEILSSSEEFSRAIRKQLWFHFRFVFSLAHRLKQSQELVDSTFSIVYTLTISHVSLYQTWSFNGTQCFAHTFVKFYWII